MDIRTITAFEEELSFIEKQAIDPATLTSIGIGGKYLVNNALHEYGHHIPILRRMAGEVAGIGARTAMQGKPLLSAPLRHAARISGEGQLMGLYERAHQAATLAKKKGISLSNARDAALKSDLAQHYPGAKAWLDTAKDIPLESTGVRKVVDYGFTPVGQVAKDVKGAVQTGVSKLRSAASSLRPSFMKRSR